MRSIYSLDQTWSYQDTIIDLPHTWNREDATIRKKECYQRELNILEKHRGDKLFLEFLGAYAVCQVYLNHTFIGEHRGGYSTFRFDITAYYQWGGSNQLEVYVDNRLTEDVSPLNGDFTIYGGLYRSVNLICTPHTHFDLLYWGSQGIIIRPEAEAASSGVGNAIKHEHIERDFQLIGEIGANSIRLSHYQHTALTYDICDREGYVVWAEIPMMAMPDTEAVLKNAQDQLMELLLQNCHHPSICFWGIQNEIAMGGESMAMYRSVQLLHDKVKELFPSAITASANMYTVKNNSPLNQITDLQGYNLYYGWYYGEINDLDAWIDAFHKDNKEVALGISEYGVDCNLSFHSDLPKVKDYTEEYRALYHEKTYEIIRRKPFLWGSYVWNMFDFGSSIREEGGSKGTNCKGLVTFDRSIKKDAFYYYKAQWSREPFLHVCEKRFRFRHKQRVDIKVYSNLDTVSLLRGDDMLCENLAGNTVFIFQNIELMEGVNHFRVVGGSLLDEIVIEKVDTLHKDYVYIDPNPEINVKNWFTQQEGELDLFLENRYSILDKLGDLMEHKEAWAIVKDMLPQIAERTQPGAGVTLLWVANKMKRSIQEEQLKEVNKKLSMIEKKE
ncbi:MAG: beta-galactosidase [Clostridiales bacterium]|nr:beta-galactosidase [Clostridiales bacterium]